MEKNEAVEVQEEMQQDENLEAGEDTKNEEEATSESSASEEELSEEEKALVQESDPEREEAEKIRELGKHGYAVALVDEAKRLVEYADKQLDDCRLILREDLQAYEDAKARLKREALDETEALLEELGYDWKEEAEELEEPEVVFEAKEDVEPMYVQDVSSGKFGSFVLALLGGAATAAGIVFAAATKAGIQIDLTKMPDMETCKQALGAVAQSVGMGNDLFIGGGIAALAGLLVYGVIYGIRTSGKAKRNIEFAKRQLEEAKAYQAKKWDCKTEMDKVDAHIKDAVETLRLYEVIFTEQNGKLRRILFVEGEKENPEEYHDVSREVMRESGALIEAIKEFMATPMSEEGKLSGKSTLFLHRAKNKAQAFLDAIYKPSSH
jgi:hypothetical protein